MMTLRHTDSAAIPVLVAPALLQATAMGLQARVISVDWPPGALPLAPGDKMAAARQARYALLLRACGELGRSHLLVGHHAGDQAETFLLRLLHGSGVAGLACMPRVAEKHTGAWLVEAG
jgi:tRNA(Ile)-lysidine synthase TilS/MesJ